MSAQAGALNAVRTDRGRLYMDRIRSIIQQMEATERAQLASRESDWTNAETLSSSVTFGGSALLLILIGSAASDNLSQFHRWHHWRRIASEVPIAVIDRPPQSFRALASPAAQALARYRLPENQATRLAEQHAPAWVFLTGMKLSLSSTELRNQDGSWRTG